MSIYFATFISVFCVSAISLVGVTLLSVRESWLKKNLFIFVSIAVGALLGDAFIHLIPEALEETRVSQTVTSILIIGGILIFFVLEKFLHWHHHGEDTEEEHIHPVGKLMLTSDGLHNFLDGIIIPVGIATTLAVILHEIPQEIGDFAVLLHSGYTRSRALLVNFFSGLTALVGAVLFFAIGDYAEVASMHLIPLAAGGFIYIAVADLIPELQKTKKAEQSTYQIIAVCVGIGMMLALTLVE
jgi:zinc and cadmium transporter